MTKPYTKVVLRRWRSVPQSAIALLVDSDEGGGRVLYYEEHGPVGEIEYAFAVRRSDPLPVGHAHASFMLARLERIGLRPLQMLRRNRHGRR